MDDIEELRHAVGRLFADAGVVFSYLFGSRAQGRATPASDTDIAVRLEATVARRERQDRLLRLGAALEHVLQGPVDLVDLDEAPLRLAGRIATERIILTGHDEPDRVRFETEIVPRYLDFRYHAQRLDRMILDEMAAGRR
jgi:predicted nucleotidyltransferase